jgi:hypothetical protein
MPRALSFAAGMLFGAVAVLVPLASKGNPASKVATRVSRDDRRGTTPTPHSRRNDATKGAKPSNNDSVCEVQLD